MGKEVNHMQPIREIDNLPVLEDWAVQYDNIFAMPETVHGTVVFSPNSAFRLGSVIQIESVLYLDMISQQVTANDKYETTFQLKGPGNRILVMSEKDYQGLTSKDDMKDPQFD